MAEHAMNLMQDYKQRWLPVQQRLAGQIEQMGATGSAARKEAAGKAATDVEAQFSQAQGAVEKNLANAGAAPGSSRANLAITGMGSNLATSKGAGMAISNQQIEDAYTQGLSALMAMGRGKAASVANSLASQAEQSGRQAAADATTAAAGAQGTAGLIGQIGGYGLQSALGGMKGPVVPGGPVPGGYVAPGGQQFNNPSAYTP
jgi:hypothetical protein